MNERHGYMEFKTILKDVKYPRVIEFVKGYRISRPENMKNDRWYLWFDEYDDCYVLSWKKNSFTFYSWDEVSEFVHENFWC